MNPIYPFSRTYIVLKLQINVTCDFREIIPTAHECSIHWNDLSPSLADGSSSGLPWHCWLLWPRPPTTTHPVSSNRPASTHCSRAFCSPIGWSSSHARSWLVECCHPPLRVVSFVILFFSLPPPPFHPPRFTHTAERKGSQSEKRRPQPYRNRQQLWQPPSLCSKLASETKTRYQNILFLSAIAKIQRNGLTRGKAILLNCHFSFTQHFCLFSLQFF